jgi:hypothetical protein
MIDTFLLAVYLIRLHIEKCKKIFVISKKLTFIRTRNRQNQHVWRHSGDIMSPGNQGVFLLLKEVASGGRCKIWRIRRSDLLYNSRVGPISQRQSFRP